jgi:hypothetical protein
VQPQDPCAFVIIKGLFPLFVKTNSRLQVMSYSTVVDSFSYENHSCSIHFAATLAFQFFEVSCAVEVAIQNN